MAIRTYGLSTTEHPTWASETPYTLLTYVIPATPNGYCYECTDSGTSGENEPSWPTTPGQTVADGNPLANPIVWTCRNLLAPNPLVVTLDARFTGGYPHKDVWVKSARPFSTGKDTFTVWGSFDGENWRQIDEMEAPQNANKADRYKGFENAYPYIRCGVASDYACEIELVAGE